MIEISRYTVILTINDFCVDIFGRPPPEAALPELESIIHKNNFVALWESEPMWEEVLRDLNGQVVKCSVHDDRKCPLNGETFAEVNTMSFVTITYEKHTSSTI